MNMNLDQYKKWDMKFLLPLLAVTAFTALIFFWGQIGYIIGASITGYVIGMNWSDKGISYPFVILFAFVTVVGCIAHWHGLSILVGVPVFIACILVANGRYKLFKP